MPMKLMAKIGAMTLPVVGGNRQATTEICVIIMPGRAILTTPMPTPFTDPNLIHLGHSMMRIFGNRPHHIPTIIRLIGGTKIT